MTQVESVKLLEDISSVRKEWLEVRDQTSKLYLEKEEEASKWTEAWEAMSPVLDFI
jgi:hypothetical protein